MCGRIDCFLEGFKSLHIKKDRLLWPPQTTCRAPDKPLLLLSVLDLVEARKITRNFIELSRGLETTFTSYWNSIIADAVPPDIAQTFIALGSEPFWRLAAKPNVEIFPGHKIVSRKEFHTFYFGARLDEDLFPLLLMPHLRERLRMVLVTTYFSTDMAGEVGGKPVRQMESSLPRQFLRQKTER